MGNEWAMERFERMAQLVRDTVNPCGMPGFPYIGLEHIGEGSLSLLGAGVAEDAASLKCRFRRGDILFGRLRPYFRKVVRAPFDGICSTDIWVVRPRAGVDSVFLFYLMASDLFIEPVVRASEGTKMPRAKWEYACELEEPLPTAAEQRAIAHILGTLDDKIELNRRMSGTLEAMARALFKSWFVDFDPVRAKAEGRDPGLPKSIADLFPACLVDSEIGEIPEGWEVGSIADLTDVSSGKRPAARFSEPSPEASVPLWGGNGPMAFVPEPLTTEPILLTGRVGTLGSVFRIYSPCWPSDNTLVVQAKRLNAFEYLFLQLSQIDYASLNRGSTQPLLTQTDLKSQRVILPNIKVLDYFSRLTSSAYRRIDDSEDESRTLAALRDTLLPKLISGELRIKDAEKFLGRASV